MAVSSQSSWTWGKTTAAGWGQTSFIVLSMFFHVLTSVRPLSSGRAAPWFSAFQNIWPSILSEVTPVGVCRRSNAAGWTVTLSSQVSSQSSRWWASPLVQSNLTHNSPMLHRPVLMGELPWCTEPQLPLWTHLWFSVCVCVFVARYTAVLTLCSLSVLPSSSRICRLTCSATWRTARLIAQSIGKVFQRMEDYLYFGDFFFSKLN